MILVQTMPLLYSILFSISLSGMVFAWRYGVLRKKALKALYSLPSVLVAGPKLSGKSSLIMLMTNERTAANIFKDDINLCRLKIGGRMVQFIEMPYFSGASVGLDKAVNGHLDIASELEKIKKLNLNRMIYVFDMSESSNPLEKQLEYLDYIRKAIRDVPLTIIANKTRGDEGEKLGHLRNRFGKVYEVSAFKEDGIESKNLMQLRKEFEDVSDLMADLSHGIADDSRTTPENASDGEKLDGSSVTAHK